jgi:chromosome segregation ATPase
MLGRKPDYAGAAGRAPLGQKDLVLPTPREDGERLQRIAVVVESVAGELARVETLRQQLQALRGPMATEFDAQMKSIAQTAELGHRLSSTATRLAEREASLASAKDQVRERQTKLEQTSAALEAQTAAKNAAETEVAELRPALAQVNLQIEALRRRLGERDTECSDLQIEKKSLSGQIETLTALNKELSGRAEQLQHDFAAANDQLADVRKRGEAVQVKALRAERLVDDLNAVLSVERDRVAELEGRAQAAQEAASRTIAALQAKDDERLVEIAALRNKLGDIQTRCASLEEAREKSVTELLGLNTQRSALVRDLAARDVELLQLKNRLQGLEAGLEESRRRVADVDAARMVAVQRSDGLAKQLTALEGRSARADLVVEQRGAELGSLRALNDELKAKLATTTQDLQGVIVQQKSEIEMLRGALAAVQTTKQTLAEAS